jgi:hypothetical protein
MATATAAKKAAPKTSGKSFHKAGAAPKLKVVTPEPTPMQEWAEDLPEEWQECRLNRHIFRPYTVGWEDDVRLYRQKKECATCGTFRTQWVNEDGYLAEWKSTVYEYPEGYKAPKGTGYWDADGRAILRKADIQRSLKLVK